MMNKNTSITQYLIVLSVSAFLLLSFGCSLSRNTKTAKLDKFEINKTIKIFSPPQTLIPDYSNMKENRTVSWLWVKQGFDLNSCAAINILPVKNYSSVDYKWAETALTQKLKNIFTPHISKAGDLNVDISSAIIEIVPKKRFFDKSVIPKLSVEVIISDKETKTIYCKISHFKQAGEFKDALNELTVDLKTVADKTLGK